MQVATHNQIATAHQTAIARSESRLDRIEAILEANAQALAAHGERFDAEIFNLVNLITAQAESVQRVEDSVQRLADILSDRFRSNGH
ncbi:MAG: hypothetical protein KME27_23115 [Lyngbya sp. HA4199-MV5]|nr:hypothetical protein [Lyngbya sp. HA4199-MV5]